MCMYMERVGGEGQSPYTHVDGVSLSGFAESRWLVKLLQSMAFWSAYKKHDNENDGVFAVPRFGITPPPKKK